MIVTPFGDLEFGVEDGLQDWLQAHDTRHRVEQAQIILASGIPLTTRDLTQPPTDDWLFMHMMMHGAMMPFSSPDPTVSSTLLEMPWGTPDNFYAWHEMHIQIHATLDRKLGIQ